MDPFAAASLLACLPLIANRGAARQLTGWTARQFVNGLSVNAPKHRAVREWCLTQRLSNMPAHIAHGTGQSRSLSSAWASAGRCQCSGLTNTGNRQGDFFSRRFLQRIAPLAVIRRLQAAFGQVSPLDAALGHGRQGIRHVASACSASPAVGFMTAWKCVLGVQPSSPMLRRGWGEGRLGLSNSALLSLLLWPSVKAAARQAAALPASWLPSLPGDGATCLRLIDPVLHMWWLK
jgi:hypothetical protein